MTNPIDPPIDTPRFSVVVPAYNASETLRETLDALVAQSFADWECVVVDDGSQDDTLAIAHSYSDIDPRFRAIHQENQGSGGAYNTGVRAARGDFVVLCSADDILLPAHMEKMSAFIAEEPGYDIYSSNGYFWFPGRSKEPVYPTSDYPAIRSFSLSETILWCFYSVGAAYKREWFDRVGGYRVDVFGEDYDFWMKAMALGARHRFTPEALSLHRKTESQKSADIERAYRSDIRLVTELAEEFELSAEEQAAVDQCVATRLRYIAELKSPGSGEASVSARGRALGLGSQLRRFLSLMKRSITR